MTALAPVPWAVGRVFEHRFLQYRRSYRATIFSSFLTPVLFLASMGLGLGTYVDARGIRRSGACPISRSSPPGCLPRRACSRRRSRRRSRSWPGSSGRGSSTPCTRPRSTGGTSRSATSPGSRARMLLVAAIFTLVIVLFGAALSPLVVLAIPVAALTGLAFAAPIVAFSATQRTPDRFNALFRFGITPLFLFSGTFYPVESLPTFLQPLAWITPLWHGVALCSRPVARDDRRGPAHGRGPPGRAAGVRRGRDVRARSGPSTRSCCADDGASR